MSNMGDTAIVVEDEFIHALIPGALIADRKRMPDRARREAL